jgi:hypothetical protein
MRLCVLFLTTVLAVLDLDFTSLLQTSGKDFDKFSGTMEVKEDRYRVQCDCSNEGIVMVEEVRCQPSKLKLTEERPGTGTSYEDLLKILEDYKTFTYAKVTHSSFRCLDGRVSEGILGTPGGDAGEFLLALLVYEDLIDSPLNSTFVAEAFELYLKCMSHPRFYMCTDQSAVDHLAKELVLSDLDLFSPKPSQTAALLEALKEPDNIGDSHLSLMLTYPDLYSIRPETVKNFIDAFFNVLWDQTNPLREAIYLEVLQGPHTETGFLEVRVNPECINEQVAPLVTPTTGDGTISLLVDHIDAVGIRRSQMAQFFADRIDKGQKITPKRMESRLQHHGLLFLDVTGSYVAKNLPFYTAEFV